MSTCDAVSTYFHGFVRAAIFMHALTIVCVFFPSINITINMFILYLREMMLFFNMFVFSADISCRMTPHVHKDFPFCIVFLPNFALQNIVED